MLRRLALKNFKSFADEQVTLAPFTLLVGANASGKSNFLDALRFLHGIAQGWPIRDVVAGRFDGSTKVWQGIRGWYW
jgi:AAA15 family ATPase/GTPase